MSDPRDRPKRSFPRPLGVETAAAAGRAYAARGFSDARLIRNWTEIAGAEIARLALPERLSLPKGQTTGGTLTLRAVPGAALLLQHQTVELIARINGAFGQPLVAQLKFVQGERRVEAAPDVLPLAVPAGAAPAGGIADGELAAVLGRLAALLSPVDKR